MNQEKDIEDTFKEVLRKFRGRDAVHLTTSMKISVILFYIITTLMALKTYGALTVFTSAFIIAIAAGLFYKRNNRGKEVKIAILSRAFIVLPGPVLTSVVFGTSCGLFALVLATIVTVLWCKQDITKMEQ